MKEKWKNSKLYLGWKKLMQDLKPMTFLQRVDHLWTYYKYYLLVVFFVVIGIGMVSSFITEQNKQVLVSGMMVNIAFDQEGMNYLTTDYAQHLGATKSNQVAELDYTSFGDPLDAKLGQDSYYTSIVLPARVSAASLDYMILDQYSMEFYIAYEVYLDLREFFTEEELSALTAENRVIFAQQEGYEERWPVAVKITDIPFIRDNLNSESEVYFALSGNASGRDMNRHVWDYIHSWEEE